MNLTLNYNKGLDYEPLIVQRIPSAFTNVETESTPASTWDDINGYFLFIIKHNSAKSSWVPGKQFFW